MYGSFYESIPTELEADSVYAFVFYEFLNGHNSLRDTSEVVGRAKLTNGKFVLKLQTLNNDMLCYNVSKMFQAGLDISDKDARVNGVLVRLMSNGYKLSEMFLRNNFDNNTVIRGYYICSDRVVSIKGVETRKDLPYSSVLNLQCTVKKRLEPDLGQMGSLGLFYIFCTSALPIDVRMKQSGLQPMIKSARFTPDNIKFILFSGYVGLCLLADVPLPPDVFCV